VLVWAVVDGDCKHDRQVPDNSRLFLDKVKRCAILAKVRS